MTGEPPLFHSWSHTHSIISTIAFPQHKILFAGTHDSKILCFDLTTYNLIKTVKVNEDSDDGFDTKASVLCLAKSEDEKYLFSAGTDSIVRVWSVGCVLKDFSIRIQNIAVIYSVMDIGDIFSVKYVDSLDTLIFGCQNASMLYINNFLASDDSSLSEHNFKKLPHVRYSKFFDSTGLTGYNKCCPTRGGSPLSSDAKCIIQAVPSDKIITYAHNGFIYSITRIENFEKPFSVLFKPYSLDRKTAFFVSSGGDGISKIWALTTPHLDSICDVRVNLIKELDNEETVFSQFVEFPFLYCGLESGLIKIWDLNTGQLITKLKTNDDNDIMAIAVYNDHVFAAHENRITKFYQGEMQEWNVHDGLVLSCELLRKCHTGNKVDRLITGGTNGTLALWNIDELVNDSKPDENEEEQGAGTPDTTDKASHALMAYRRAKLDNDHMLEMLQEFVGYQTVSQNPDSRNVIDGRRCATFLQDLFVKFGAHTCEQLPAGNGGNPVVVAFFKSQAENPKSILWYGHYDVVGVSDPSSWNTEPFTLVCEDGYLKGRGVSDNKGPLLSAVYSAADLTQKGELKNNIVFLIEGQEENGSSCLRKIIEENPDVLNVKIDWILFSNSYWLDQKVPCLNYGHRGVMNAQVTVFSDEPNRHTGVDGGVHREPTADLINIVSKLTDDRGHIQIPGFYDSLKEVSDNELAKFKEIVNRAELAGGITVEQLVAKWTKPSLSLTNIQTTVPGVTVISQKASLVVSIRLVPDQNPTQVKESLIQFLQDAFKSLNTSNHLELEVLNIAEPWLGNPHNRCYKLLREEIHNTWGSDPLFIREGGSIPCIRFLESHFNAPVAQIPCGQSTDNAHLDNENLKIKNWANMRKIVTKVFNRL
ncbi:HBR401Cp [Eremothecium sinecaudum]|uniref:HBR401Cp n=1 Tax=Eremothecium sinecaudum TaxID=45286 RepID=A0A109UXU6_9SACH|nr:HBR401Cp [Eremothecium sinecaudum]AMD19302.1 HBR401Cp [Eremothecium sinecaudum]